MNENDNDMKLVRKRLALYMKTLVLFITAIVLLCFFVFIFNYDIAFVDSGDIIPQSFNVVIYYFFLSIIAIIAAIVIKILLNKEASLSLLLILAIIIPIFCYNINRQTLKENGAFHFLVDEGGIFHFIAIKDFNFDGMNDKEYQLMYGTHTVSTTEYGDSTDKIIKYIRTETTGIGKDLRAFNTYDEKERKITLHLQKNNVVYEKIEMIIDFYDPNYIKSFNISLTSKNHFGEMDPVIYKLDCEYKTNEDNTLSIILNSEDCLKIQNNAERDSIEIVFAFSVF